MELVLRAFLMYWFIMIVFRITGKRSLGEVTTFDFVLLLIVGESAQQALLGQDYSITGAMIVISTLFTIEIVLTTIQSRSKSVKRFFEDEPVILIDQGRLLQKRMKKEQIDQEDILHAARKNCGIGRLDQIQYAILEKDGSISIISWEQKAKGPVAGDAEAA